MSGRNEGSFQRRLETVENSIASGSTESRLQHFHRMRDMVSALRENDPTLQWNQEPPSYEEANAKDQMFPKQSWWNWIKGQQIDLSEKHIIETEFFVRTQKMDKNTYDVLNERSKVFQGWVDEHKESFISTDITEKDYQEAVRKLNDKGKNIDNIILQSERLPSRSANFVSMPLNGPEKIERAITEYRDQFNEVLKIVHKLYRGFNGFPPLFEETNFDFGQVGRVDTSHFTQ